MPALPRLGRACRSTCRRRTPSTNVSPAGSPIPNGTTAPARLPDHVRVLEAEAPPDRAFVPDPRLVARVRRKFAPLHPRRVILSRQLDGEDLDLDAVVAARADLAAGHAGNDRLWAASRFCARDLSVAILMDCSRSTEAMTGSRAVIETAREALAALVAGIDSAGDRLAVWGARHSVATVCSYPAPSGSRRRCRQRSPRASVASDRATTPGSVPVFDARARRELGPFAYQSFLHATAHLSLAPFFDRRWRQRNLRRLGIRAGIGLLVWLAALALHGDVIGVSPLPI